MKIPGLIYTGILKWLDKHGSDESYIKWMFYHRLGYWPNLKFPMTFNEKMNWIKLYDKNPKFIEYADKYTVRQHIKEVMGEEYLIPLLGVYERAEDIDFTVLPNRFVLKCNNGAGFNLICKDKSRLNTSEAIAKLNKWLKTDFSRGKREWYYKEIPPKILCESYMEDKQSDTLFDYKVFCIGGKVQFIQVDFDRFSDHKRNIYDCDWNLLDWGINFPRDEKRVVEKPSELSNMIKFSELLSSEFRQLRADFYVINDHLYFGEMTFFTGGGFTNFIPREKDRQYGDMLIL